MSLERRSIIILGIIILGMFSGLAGYYNFSENFIDLSQTWIVFSLMIGSITSFFAAKYANIIDELTSGLLIGEYLYIENFFVYDFSISIFKLVALIIEFLLFS